MSCGHAHHGPQNMEGWRTCIRAEIRTDAHACVPVHVRAHVYACEGAPHCSRCYTRLGQPRTHSGGAWPPWASPSPSPPNTRTHAPWAVERTLGRAASTAPHEAPPVHRRSKRSGCGPSACGSGVQARQGAGGECGAPVGVAAFSCEAVAGTQGDNDLQAVCTRS